MKSLDTEVVRHMEKVLNGRRKAAPYWSGSLAAAFVEYGLGRRNSAPHVLRPSCRPDDQIVFSTQDDVHGCALAVSLKSSWNLPRNVICS